jgi:hypothetical protein
LDGASTSIADALWLRGRWYAATSPWNTPLPADVPIAPNSAGFITALNDQWCGGGGGYTGCLGPSSTSVPSVWYAPTTTPLVTVQIDVPTCNARQVRIPIPANAVPSSTPWLPSGDPEPRMAIMGEDGTEWDLWKVTRPGVTPLSSGPDCPATSNWAATVEYHHSPGWTTGAGWNDGGARASGTWEGSGLIRPRDIQTTPTGGTWDHAIAFSYRGTLAGAFVYPATSHGAACTDASICIPMGARIQMDPSINCATWPSLVGEWQRQLCRTMQKYGLIVVDTGGGLGTEQIASRGTYEYPWESAATAGQFYGHSTLPSDISTHLRVIDWTKWTGQ